MSDRIQRRPAKIGTMPGYPVWVMLPKGEPWENGIRPGSRVRFREELRHPWRDGIVRSIGPEPELRLYIDLE